MSRFEQFSAQGAPSEAFMNAAGEMLDQATATLEQPGAWWGFTGAVQGRTGETSPMVDDWLEGLLVIPRKGPGGVPWTPEKRRDFAILASRLAATMRDQALPRWAAEAVLADAVQGKTKQRLVVVPKDEAARFIEKHHSQLPYLNPRGLMYALGVVYNNRLVAVATAGTPTGNWARAAKRRGVSPHAVLELTRVASDGTVKGAASKLTSRLLDLAPRSGRGVTGPWLFITYQLADEAGTSYRALADKGLRPVEFVKGRKTTSGQRATTGASSLAAVNKIRWEAGPVALPADWPLLEKPRMVPYRTALAWYQLIHNRAPAHLKQWMDDRQVMLLEGMTSELIPKTGPELTAWMAEAGPDPAFWNEWFGFPHGTIEKYARKKKLPKKFLKAQQQRAYVLMPLRGDEHDWHTGYWWWPDYIDDPTMPGNFGYQHIARGPDDPERKTRKERQEASRLKRSEFTKQRFHESATARVKDLGKGTELQWAQVLLDVMRDGRPRTFNAMLLEASDYNYTADTAFGQGPDRALWYLVGQGLLEHEPQGKEGRKWLLFRLREPS